MSKLVVIYTLKNCSFCTNLKESCDKEGITYISKDIDDRMHEKEYELMKTKSNNEYLPLIRIGSKLLVANKDWDELHEAITIIKENI